ncbi:MAG: efflux RND transporter periplasmic adaptor subunit [Gammaproteobacteria bacterium]
MSTAARKHNASRRPRRAARGALAGLALGILPLLLALPVQAQQSITIQPLSELLVPLERRAPAEVLPLNDALLSAEIPGVIEAVHVEVGEAVAAGAVLLQVEEDDYRLALAQAEASLASARARKAQAVAQLERARKLAGENYVSADELLNRETALAVAEADIQGAEVAIRVAQRNLEKCRVVAPFAGVVTARDAQLGAFVVNGSPLLRLVQTDRFELDAELPSVAADSLRDASALWFEAQGERWPLRLLRLSPVVERERRARRARLAFTGAAAPVGQSGELVWVQSRGVLPANLVSRRNGELGLFLHDGGRAVFHPLPEAQEGRPAETDLPPDSEVIVTGRDRLQDGDAVVPR